MQSSLCPLAVSNGREGGQIYPPGVNLKILAVLNGLSLVTLKSEEFTLSSGSFELGGGMVGSDLPPQG